MSDKYNKIMHQNEIHGVSLSGWMYRILGMKLAGFIERIFTND